jgi:hypothetical protein
MRSSSNKTSGETFERLSGIHDDASRIVLNILPLPIFDDLKTLDRL